jgi:hypothetical protein
MLVLGIQSSLPHSSCHELSSFRPLSLSFSLDVSAQTAHTSPFPPWNSTSCLHWNSSLTNSHTRYVHAQKPAPQNRETPASRLAVRVPTLVLQGSIRTRLPLAFPRDRTSHINTSTATNKRALAYFSPDQPRHYTFDFWFYVRLPSLHFGPATQLAISGTVVVLEEPS